jgi:hypothetical protein
MPPGAGAATPAGAVASRPVAPPLPVPDAAGALRVGLLGLQELAAPAAPRGGPDVAATAGRPNGERSSPPLRGAWPEPEPPPARPAAVAGDEPRATAGAVIASAAGAVDAALARIVLDQIASLPGDDVGRPAQPGDRTAATQWSFELPFALDGRPGSLRFQVERDGHGDGRSGGEPSRRPWRLRLAFSVEPLGPVRAQLGLLGGRLAVGIWAERPETVAALAAEAGTLGAALAAADFEVDEIHVAAGLPPDAARRGARTMVDRTA